MILQTLIDLNTVCISEDRFNTLKSIHRNMILESICKILMMEKRMHSFYCIPRNVRNLCDLINYSIYATVINKVESIISKSIQKAFSIDGQILPHLSVYRIDIY